MSGRFFRNFSESETESSEAESDVPAPTKTLATAYTFSDDDDEEETKRVVRSTKEKRFEELQTLIKQARNHKKNKDIAKVLDGFEELCRLYLKAKSYLDKDSDLATPRIYLRYLSELDQFTNDLWNDKEVKKNMSKNNSKSLAILRQKLRKYLKDFESEIEVYRANQDQMKDDSDVDSDASDKLDEEDEQVASGDEEQVQAKSKFIKKGSDDESDSEWDSEDEESSMSSEDEGEDLRSKFLKRDQEPKEVKEVTKKKKEKKEKIGKEKDRKKDKEEEEDKEEEKRPGKQKLFSKQDELNHVEVLNKVYEILAMRGKRKIQRSEQLKMLNEILVITSKQNLGPAMEIKILLGIITSLFDYNPNTQLCIKQSLWLRCLKYIILLLQKLSENPDISIGEDIPEEQESYAAAPFKINGCIVTIIERMDLEFTRILQAADAHSPEYVEKLKFENIVNKIIIRLQQYLEEKKATTSDLCRTYLLRIVHLYYKYDSSLFKSDEEIKSPIAEEKIENETVAAADDADTTETKTEEPQSEEKTDVEATTNEQQEQPAAQPLVKKPVDKLKELQIEVTETNENSLQLMDRLCKFIYTHDTTDRIRTQAILYHIYHHALHDNWFEARDLMLMSQLQHNILKADIPLHIIYNRALVQLGLCAFRHGFIREAHMDLLDIHIQSRAKELLAQGILPKNQERTLEQEKEEKQRLLPFHMHINLELLECAYLVSAMLLEIIIPDVAANEYNVRKKIITRPFYNQLRKNEEQSLLGLPESMREHVIAASKAMRIGNWKQCQEYIINDKMNNKVWNLFHQPNKVREMLKQKIKEESLRAYLFTYSHVYDSISLLTLSDMFELENTTVHGIISKMIIKQELMGSLDEPTQALVMHRTEPSRIQGLSLQLMDKINYLVDFNEKLYEMKQNTGSQNKQQYRNRNYENRNDHQNRNLNKNRDHHNRRHNKGHHNRNKRPIRNQNEN